MSRKSIWERLQGEVRLPELGQRVRKGSDDESDIEARVEELWKRASAEAQRRGVSVKDVLSEMGFSPEEFEQAQPGSQEGPAGPPSEPEPTPMTTGIQSAIANPFPDIPASDLVRIMNPTGDIIRRMRLLAERAPTARLERLVSSGQPLQSIAELFKAGFDQDVLGTAVRCRAYGYPSPGGDDGFGDFLLIEELLSFRDARELEKTSETSPELFLGAAVERSMLSARGLTDAIGRFTGVAPWEDDDALSPCLGDDLPFEWAEGFGMVPVESRAALLVVAAPYVPTRLLTRRVEMVVGHKVEWRLITPVTSRRLWADFVRLRAAQGSTVAPPLESTTREPAFYPKLVRAIGRRSGVEVVDAMLEAAIEADATDIHLEQYRDESRIRFRVDGILHVAATIPASLYEEVNARIKVLGDMDITERFQPQDGHIHWRRGSEVHDMRVATAPAKRGEKVAIRIASTGRIDTRLQRLGFSDQQLSDVMDAIRRPYGLILATGPVGSGKTTTLYACLNEIDREQGHVATIEDPVEIELAGATQLEVNYETGFDFIAGLRALLRQDPDALLLGEVRDRETAEIALRASMTGRMVFSTMHANDSVAAINAMRHFGLPSHVISSALQCVIAQRLVRRLCAECSVPSTLDDIEIERLQFAGVQVQPDHPVRRPVGCSSCRGGYNGRVAVVEVLRIDPHLQEMIQDNASHREVREYALSAGLKTLVEDCYGKILSGRTSYEEFERVIRI